MKRIIIFFLLAFPVFFTSCTVSDSDEDQIEKDVASLYIGTWNVYEPDKKLNYKVTIDRYENSYTEIVLHNFADLGGSVIGSCTETTFTISSQDIGENYSVEGVGHYVNKDKLTVNYSLSDGIDLETHEATFTK